MIPVSQPKSGSTGIGPWKQCYNRATKRLLARSNRILMLTLLVVIGLYTSGVHRYKLPGDERVANIVAGRTEDRVTFVNGGSFSTEKGLAMTEEEKVRNYNINIEKLPSFKAFTGNFTHFRLKVPFYVYGGDLDWSNAIITYHDDNKNVSVKDSWDIGKQNWKHMDDWWHYRHALNHKMRTRDPSKAKLFFVPLMLNAYGTHAYEQNLFCDKGRCGEALMNHASKVLEESEWFQRNQGRDHVLVDSHYRPEVPVNSSLFMCNQIIFENEKHKGANYSAYWKSLGRIGLSSMYVGRGCKISKKKKGDFALIGQSPKRSAFDTRRNICKWIRSGRFSATKCGQGAQCPALAEARFGFHARGDTFGANRLIDTLLSRTVPIFTAWQQYTILPDFIPWKDLGYLVPVNNATVFYEALRDIEKISDKAYQTKLELIDRYMPLFNHKRPFQFDMYMTRFAELLGLQ